MEVGWTSRRWCLLLLLLAQAVVLTRPCPQRCTCHPLAVLGMSGADCASKSLVAVPRARGGEKHLQVVDLSGNRLRSLPDDAFAAFPSLKYLFLSDNMIQVVNQYAFRGVPELEVLYLSENSLTSLPPDLFEECVALRKVVLRGNPLLRLLPPAPPPPPGAPASPARLAPFITSHSLQELDASACGVDFIPNEAFSALPSLKKLNLSSNSLTEVDPRPFGPLCSLAHLDITGNPIQCGCSTARLSRWIRERRVETARPLACSGGTRRGEVLVDENEEEKMSQSVSPRCDMLLLKEEKFYTACQAALAEAEELQRQAVETKRSWIIGGIVALGVAVAVLIVACFFRRHRQKKRLREERAARVAAKEKNGLDHQPLRDDADG